MRRTLPVAACAILVVVIVWAATAGIMAYGGSPYPGSPAAIPGTIAADSFDNGGEGVAYHDTTAGNTGGAYRQTDVDIEASSEGSCDVGWIAPGEWLNYTVAVADAGAFTVQLRVASAAGATLHVGFNSASNVWTTVAVPATGGWQAWTTVSVPVTLGAGVQQMTLYFDTGGLNLESIQVEANGTGAGTLTPYSGVPTAIPGAIPAANFDNGGEAVAYHDTTPGNSGGAYRQTDVDIEASSEGTYDVGWIAPGEWLNYTMSVASAASYTVQLRVSSPGGATLHVGFNAASNVWTSVAIPATGGWQAWTTVSVPVSLGSGVQQMTLYFDTGGLNLEAIQVAASGTGTGTPTPYSGVPAAIPGTITAANFDNGGEGVAYHDTTPGNTGGAYRQTDVDVEASSEGSYDVGWIAAAEWLNYTVAVANAGAYTVQLRVASPGGATLHVGFNGASSVWTTVAIPATGGWQTWTTVSVPVTLGAGAQQMTLYFDTGGLNLETIEIDAGGSTGAPAIQTVFVIVMENQNWSDIRNNPAAPYINSLLPYASHAEQYYTAPGVHPSMPNYLWMEAGQDFGTTGVDSTPSLYSQSTTNHLVTQLNAAGIAWTAYEEGIAAGECPLADQYPYLVRHDPFVYFNDVTGNQDPASAYCIAHVRPYSELADALARNTVARYNFITPNACDDMHDCSIGQGDTWLSQQLPAILASQAYRDGGVVFLVWDEGSNSSDGPLPLIVLSPAAKGGGYANSIYYTHSSLLRTIQEIFGVRPFLGDAANAVDLSDLFAAFPR